ncbi:hypothetical protein ABZ845_04125 [Streptomyces sp. NPDC047022]|uniref:hypothetical protein n=1 Tax=Streptomyces sp. NPDC047022 TaxID=3155737 RepID=UPI0033EAF68C
MNDTQASATDGWPRMSDAEANAEAQRIIDAVYRPTPPTRPIPTFYRDDTEPPPIGGAQPVPQPDHRIVPPWAAGTAVAGIGTGAAFVGVGCGIWLACKGFAAVTLTSVLFVTLPIAALAAVTVAVGSAVRSVKATRTETHHHYAGPVRQETNTITAPVYGLIARNRNELHR